MEDEELRPLVDAAAAGPAALLMARVMLSLMIRRGLLTLKEAFEVIDAATLLVAQAPRPLPMNSDLARAQGAHLEVLATALAVEFGQRPPGSRAAPPPGTTE